MKRAVRFLAAVSATALVLTGCSTGAGKSDAPKENTASSAFEAKLDTEKAVELNVAVFFGNFEAFDQVINDFNEYYPKVTISYSQTSDTSDEQFLIDNPSTDIFMVSAERGYPTEACVNLKEAGVDFSAVSEGLLESNTVEGKILALPMGLILRGMVVNKTLLEKEGLKEPQTWQEFLDVLEALKEKGYVPIQGPNTVMGMLGYNMGMSLLNSDADLLKAVSTGDAAGAAALEPVYERMFELCSKGYLSQEVNAEYPEDNYEGSILKFFEGDVPFWVCDTEKVSGMKKRESKSEAFSANPFEYEFTYIPMGDNGVYEYIQPWYAFAVNKDSQAEDYAAEFLRFMAREEELNTLASVKGVPSVTKDAPDERYSKLSKIEKVEKKVIADGTVPGGMGVLLCNTANDRMTSGELDAGEALATFVERCQ